MNYGEGAYKFLNYLRVVKNASEHTLRNYALDLKAFKIFFEEEILKLKQEDCSKKLIPGFSDSQPSRFSAKDIDKRSLRIYLAALSAKSATKKTVLRRLSSLRSFYKYLIKERLIEHNPLDEIDSPKLEKKIPPSLTYDQIECFFGQPDISRY